VVDNASSEPIKELKESFPSVNFIESNENLGFAGGHNLAIQQSKGEVPLHGMGTPESVKLSNKSVADRRKYGVNKNASKPTK
jgi:hypothetical protein